MPKPQRKGHAQVLNCRQVQCQEAETRGRIEVTRKPGAEPDLYRQVCRVKGGLEKKARRLWESRYRPPCWARDSGWASTMGSKARLKDFRCLCHLSLPSLLEEAREI